MRADWWPAAAGRRTAAAAAGMAAAAAAPVWPPGSWTGSGALPEPESRPVRGAGRRAPGWEAPAAGGKGTGQIEVRKLGNMVSAVAPGTRPAAAPGPGGACEAADRAVLPGYGQRMRAPGGAAPGKASAHLAVQRGAGSRASAAGQGEGPGQAGRSTGPGTEAHNLLVPVGRRTPSEQNTREKRREN